MAGHPSLTHVGRKRVRGGGRFIFLGYSTSSKAYRVFNKRTLVVEESIHVVFDESRNQSDHPIEEEENIIEDKLEDKLDDLNQNKNNLEENEVNDTSKKDLDTSLPKDWRYASSHPQGANYW